MYTGTRTHDYIDYIYTCLFTDILNRQQTGTGGATLTSQLCWHYTCHGQQTEHSPQNLLTSHLPQSTNRTLTSHLSWHSTCHRQQTEHTPQNCANITLVTDNKQNTHLTTVLASHLPQSINRTLTSHPHCNITLVTVNKEVEHSPRNCTNITLVKVDTGKQLTPQGQ